MRTLLYPLLALGLFGADWPQFRGPDGSGLCPSCGPLPTEFGPQKNVLWKTEVPVGKSSPILAGDRIFLTASQGDDLITMCLSRTTGKVQWRRSVRAARREAEHTLNHRAALTAAVRSELESGLSAHGGTATALSVPGEDGIHVV